MANFKFSTLDWNDLRYFLAVARTGSTLAAGRALRVSQTTAARRVTALEESLGLVLFDRRPTDGSSYTDSLVTSMQNILEGLNTWPAALTYAGDFTKDQWLTPDDIMLFKQALSLGSETAFTQAYPTARYSAGDFDGNGQVNASDVAGFIGSLQHAGVPAEYIDLVPEPSTKWILLAGILTVCCGRSATVSSTRRTVARAGKRPV